MWVASYDNSVQLSPNNPAMYNIRGHISWVEGVKGYVVSRGLSSVTKLIHYKSVHNRRRHIMRAKNR